MHKIIKDPKYNYLRVDPIPSMEIVEKYYKEDFYSETVPEPVIETVRGYFLFSKLAVTV